MIRCPFPFLLFSDHSSLYSGDIGKIAGNFGTLSMILYILPGEREKYQKNLKKVSGSCEKTTVKVQIVYGGINIRILKLC